MISNNKIKLIRSLEYKKGREKAQLFVAEGPKIVNDLLASGFEAVEIFDEFEDIKKISFLQHPQNKMGIFKLKSGNIRSFSPEKELAIGIDDVQDPGNFGTIIRIADWFGIKHIFCSLGTVDCWNPKVIQATMGSIARVEVHYLDLNEFIDSLPPHYPIYGTVLDGNDIYNEELTPNGIIIMGNEGKGISKEIRNKINKKLLIPNFSKQECKAESLNVAIATAITCAEFRRR
ncbi:RNA methyltransferase [Prevotella brunnea]|uniref:RNA methyltransferase n=1 Tax=Prevotella brunnea TaxID=2508867 RepID=UPI00282FAD18|nr:RNA methyltransferase [Prevotella brunnea]MDR0186845.1 RNA methyltransferase [Prevotella brunnea]